MIDWKARWAQVVEWCKAHPVVVTHATAFVLGFIVGRML